MPNKPKVTLIVGLPGSGKTHLAESLGRISNCYRPTIVVDDPIYENMPAIEEAIKTGKSLIITDPHFCVTKTRNDAKTQLETWGAEVEMTFFENNPEACLVNVKFRDDGRAVESFIKILSSLYEPPTEVWKCKIWQPGDDPR